MRAQITLAIEILFAVIEVHEEVAHKLHSVLSKVCSTLIALQAVRDSYSTPILQCIPSATNP